MKHNTIIRLNFFVLFSILLSCNNNSIGSKFIGTWIANRTNFYNSDSTKSVNTSLQQGLPILLDFKKNNDLSLKVFGDSVFNLKWHLENDTILNIDNYKYRIIAHSKDSITLGLIRYGKKLNYCIYKIKDAQIKSDSISIIKNLCKTTWWHYIANNKEVDYINTKVYTEFFANNTKLLKYQRPCEDTLSDSVVHLKINRWAIDRYKDYYFISECYHQLAGTSPYDIIYQIEEINDSIFEISNPRYTENNKTKLFAYKSKVNLEAATNKMTGLWKSKNLKEKSYGNKLSNRLIKKGVIKKFEGDLYYKFNKSNLIQYGTDTDTLISKWYFNNDCTVFLYENHHEYGINVLASEIDELNDSILRLKLSYNKMPGNTNKPREYILNINQHFVKLKMKTKN